MARSILINDNNNQFGDDGGGVTTAAPSPVVSSSSSSSPFPPSGGGGAVVPGGEGGLGAHALASEYVRLAVHIKEQASTLAGWRKELKRLDSQLLESMRQENLGEISVGDVQIRRTSKLDVK